MARAQQNEVLNPEAPEEKQVTVKDLDDSNSTVLTAKTGHVFQHGIDGVDNITEGGTRVPNEHVDAVLAAAARFSPDLVTGPKA